METIVVMTVLIKKNVKKIRRKTKMINKGCQKSYSMEHTFITTKPENGFYINKCVLCGYKQVVNEGIFMKKVRK
jgi:hypothetical protein